jgi:hypothetical protein
MPKGDDIVSKIRGKITLFMQWNRLFQQAVRTKKVATASLFWDQSQEGVVAWKLAAIMP